MITVINRDTCRAAYVDEKCIKSIEEFSEDIDGRAYPYSRIFIENPKENHSYCLDVIESKRKIEALMKERENGNT